MDLQEKESKTISSGSKKPSGCTVSMDFTEYPENSVNKTTEDIARPSEILPNGIKDQSVYKEEKHSTDDADVRNSSHKGKILETEVVVVGSVSSSDDEFTDTIYHVPFITTKSAIKSGNFVSNKIKRFRKNRSILSKDQLLSFEYESVIKILYLAYISILSIAEEDDDEVFIDERLIKAGAAAEEVDTRCITKICQDCCSNCFTSIKTFTLLLSIIMLCLVMFSR